MDGLIDFEAVRHTNGYELVEEPQPSTERKREGLIGVPNSIEERTYLVPAGAVTERYRPLDNFPALFQTFAKVPKEPRGVLKFASSFGLLEWPNRMWPRERAKESLDTWYRHIDKMRELIKAWEANDWDWLAHPDNRFGRADMRLMRIAMGEPPRIAISPHSLWGALLFQFAMAVAGKAKLRACEQCAKPFLYGTGTGRRSSARFCSDACRKAANREAAQ